MPPTGLGSFTLRIFGKVFQRDNKAQINAAGSLDRVSQVVLEDFPAKQAASNISLGWPGDFDWDEGITGRNRLPAWFSYLGLCQN